MITARCLIIAAVGFTTADGTGVSMAMSRANPIRKVVTMIQNIQKKVEKEGKAAEDLFEKFMCECGQQQKELTDAIAAAEAKGSDVAAASEAGDKQAKQLQADITQAKKDRAAAKDAISSATEIREKEAAAFKDMKEEASSNIDAMGKAIQAIESGGSSFLQSNSAQQLHDLVQSSESFVQQDKDEVLAFLSGEQSSEGTGEIVGILKQQQETMASDLKEAEASEADAKATYGDLVKAKTKEFETLQASIEEKMARLGELGVANAEAANDGGDTAAQLEKDKQALADSKAACADREKAFEAEKKTRAEEVDGSA
jgi:esterase/lipase